MPNKGYYSLIQYCPDMGRLEAANVGVLLFCPERAVLIARMTKTSQRIRQFFGKKGHDWKRIENMKRAMVERLHSEQGQINTLDDLQHFIDTRANLLKITPPRPVKVFDPATELDTLFRDLIREPAKKSSTKKLQTIVGEKFEKAGLDRKIIRDLSVKVPVLDQPLHVPFAFRNGRLNLIAPVPFESERATDTACRYAVEGRSLHATRDSEYGEMQLTVVGKFRSQDSETLQRVRSILNENQVKLYSFGDLSALIDEIRRTGHDAEQ